MWRVYIVSPDGSRRLAGGVRGYRRKETAEAAVRHYRKFVDDNPALRGCKIELAQE